MSPAPPTASLPLIRIIFVGAVVPAAIVALDLWLLERMSGPVRDDIAAVQALAAFIVQIGVLGVLCGRLVEPPALRWLIYGWGFVLTDAIVVMFVDTHGSFWGDSKALLMTSLLSSQLGLIVVWAALGVTPWEVRWPTSLVLVTLLAIPLVGFRSSRGSYTPLFAAQCAALFALCMALRWKGFRLLALKSQLAEPPVGSPQPRANRSASLRRRMQFGVRDLLIWTTSLAIVLAAARALDLMSFGKIAALFGRQWMVMLTSGVLSAIVLVVALWAALGEGRARLRWSLLACSAPAAGLVFALLDWRSGPVRGSITWGRRSIWDPSFFDQFVRLEWHLIAWFCLAAGLLFAALLIFRTLGYRLSRELPSPVSSSRVA